MSIGDQILAGLREHFEYVLIAVGLLILVGAIRGWGWISHLDRGNAFMHFIWELWGERGMRVLMALCGLVLIICGVVYLMA